MLLDHPVVLFRDEWLKDRGGKFRVVIAGQKIANVVEQGANYVFFVLTRLMRARRRLQAVFQPINLEAAIIATQQLQMIQHASGQPLLERADVARYRFPVLLCTVLHVGEVRLKSVFRRCSVSHSCLLLAGSIRCGAACRPNRVRAVCV